MQSFHFAEQLAEAVARGLYNLQRLSLKQFMFQHCMFSEAFDVSSDMFAVPHFELGYFCR
jgi:hypothetical protein